MDSAPTKGAADLPIRDASAAPLWLRAAVALLCLCYLVQTLSPLRLNNDGSLCLTMADRAVESGRLIAAYEPIFNDGAVALPGYPSILAALFRTGLTQPWAIILLNLVFISAGMWATMQIARAWGLSAAQRWSLAALSLLSWVVLKHATIPVTESAFFAFSSLAIALACRVSQRTTGGSAAWVATWLLAAALAALAARTRVIGVALAPALLLAVFFPRGTAWRIAEWFLARRALLIGLILGAIAFGIAVIFATRNTAYGIEFVKKYDAIGGTRALYEIPRMRLSDLGLTGLNLPTSVLTSPALARFGLLLQPAVLFAGAVFAVTLARGVWRLRTHADPALAYLLGYAALLLIWPFEDPRFLMPVIPLGLACIMRGWWSDSPGPVGTLARGGGRAWALGYAALGLVSIALTTRISLSGESFPDAYNRGGPFLDTYKAAWGQPHDPQQVVPPLLKALQNHEPRAQRAPSTPATPTPAP